MIAIRFPPDSAPFPYTHATVDAEPLLRHIGDSAWFYNYGLLAEFALWAWFMGMAEEAVGRLERAGKERNADEDRMDAWERLHWGDVEPCDGLHQGQ